MKMMSQTGLHPNASSHYPRLTWHYPQEGGSGFALPVCVRAATFGHRNPSTSEQWQDRPPQNIPLWHEDYLELKAIEENKEGGEKLSAFPLLA